MQCHARLVFLFGIKKTMLSTRVFYAISGSDSGLEAGSDSDFVYNAESSCDADSDADPTAAASWIRPDNRYGTDDEDALLNSLPHTIGTHKADDTRVHRWQSAP